MTRTSREINPRRTARTKAPTYWTPANVPRGRADHYGGNALPGWAHDLILRSLTPPLTPEYVLGFSVLCLLWIDFGLFDDLVDDLLFHRIVTLSPDLAFLGDLYPSGLPR